MSEFAPRPVSPPSWLNNADERRRRNPRSPGSPKPVERKVPPPEDPAEIEAEEETKHNLDVEG